MNAQEDCTIYIVRHGETELNVKKMLQGHNDSPLTEQGILQAKELGEKLKHIPFDEAFSSDSTRAQRTAEFILLERNLAIKTTQLLRERSYGKYEGREVSLFTTELKQYLDEFEALPHEKKFSYKYPDMESDEELIARFITFLRETAVAYQGKTVLVVSHGGMMIALLIHLGFGTYQNMRRGSVQNSAYIKLVTNGIDFSILETEGISPLSE